MAGPSTGEITRCTHLKPSSWKQERKQRPSRSEDGTGKFTASKGKPGEGEGHWIGPWFLTLKISKIVREWLRLTYFQYHLDLSKVFNQNRLTLSCTQR